MVKNKININSGGFTMERKWHSNWDGFVPGRWNRTSVNVRDFIQHI